MAATRDLTGSVAAFSSLPSSSTLNDSFEDLSAFTHWCVLMQGLHISTRELEEMGRKFCEALVKVKSRHRPSIQSLGLPPDAEFAAEEEGAEM